MMAPYADPRDVRYPRAAPHPYPAQGGYLVQVNRAQPMARPPLALRASDNMSARKVNPRNAYAPPLIIQQEKPRSTPIISARRAKTPQHSEEEEFDDDEEEETSEEETDSEEEEEEDPRVAYQEAVMRRAQQVQHMERMRVAEEEQRRMLLAAQRAKAEAARAMPPPPRPASTVNTTYNMRQPNGPPVVTYGSSPRMPNGFDDPHFGMRPPYPAGALRAPSPSGTAMPGITRSRTPGQDPRYLRRNSMYSDQDVGFAELEARERALVTREKVLDQREREQYQRQKRESFTASGADPELRSRMRRMSMAGREEHVIEDRLNDAQRYIEKNQKPTAPLTAGILKKSGLDRKAAPSTRSKKSSKEGSSTADNRKRQSMNDTESLYQEGFKMRIDAKRDYEFEIGDKRLELRPDGQGKIEIYVAGKTETQYHTSKASSSAGSKLDRRISRRTRYLDDDDDDDDDDEEYMARERPVRQEHRDVRSGAARRRAETYSGPVDSRRRTQIPLREPPVEARRTPLRRPASPVIDDNDEDDEEEEYTAPLYGGPLDEYSRPPTNRYSQGYGQYAPPSPRPGYGQGNSNSYGYGA
jgi:hypothetical protein